MPVAAYTYDERVPATTWGEHLTDDTEVWVEELAPAPEGTPSSVKKTIKSILSTEDDRLLLIGLLVEAGYAVGKKVS